MAMNDAASIGQLASTAAQFGPFLFAILFILFIPYLGQTWFAKISQTEIQGGDVARAAAVQVYRFYWISGVVAGLALTAFSVAWWSYVQMNYTLPQSEGQFDNRVNAEISKRIFEGVIHGASDDDIFIYDFADPKYKIYIYPIRYQFPMIVRYAVVLEENPRQGFRVEIQYMNKPTFDILRASGDGYKPAPLQFCLTKVATNLTLMKTIDSQPRFNESCGEPR